MVYPVCQHPGYLRSIQAPVVEGRDFTDADRRGSGPVAIVTEDMALRAGNGAAVLGRRLTAVDSDDQSHTYNIVGVVRNVRISATEAVGAAQVYVPVAQEPPESLTFVIRVRRNPEQYLGVCRDIIRRLDPQVPVFDVATFDHKLQESLARPRFYTTAVLFLGAFALLLAIIGTYGVAAYSIAQRKREIGVRIALGASPQGLRRVLLRQSLLPVSAGICVGLVGAVVLGRFLNHLIACAEPTGAQVCLESALILAATSAVGIWAATSQIMGQDPMDVIRTE